MLRYTAHAPSWVDLKDSRGGWNGVYPMPTLLSSTYRSSSPPSSSVVLGFQPLTSSICPPA